MEGGKGRGPETPRTVIHIHLNIGTESRVLIADALGKELHHPKMSKLWDSKTGPTDISKTMSPRAIMCGEWLDQENHLCLQFGEYFQV